MKKSILILGTILFLSGCSTEDLKSIQETVKDEASNITDQVNEQLDRINEYLENIKEQYKEYREGHESNEPRPYTVTYQDTSSNIIPFVQSDCTLNNDVAFLYYPTQQSATTNLLYDISSLHSVSGVLLPYVDTRYTNNMNIYLHNETNMEIANHALLTGLDARSGSNNLIAGTSASIGDGTGSVSQAKCVGGNLAFGTTLNLADSIAQVIDYAGVQSSFVYNFDDDNIRPWHSNGSGNLALQADFDRPIYKNLADNEGGGVYFNVILYNDKIHKHLNFVIGLYVFGNAWVNEKREIRFDPSTNIVHVASVASDGSWWCIPSLNSAKITELESSDATTSDDGVWDKFYRVNISYASLLEVLKQLRSNPPAEVNGIDFGLQPEDWQIGSVMVQYELEEEGGNARLSGSFHNFNAYLTLNPI